MPTFTSTKQLENAILYGYLNKATDFATEWSKLIVDSNKERFYAEYTPIEYNRTEQLKNSLDRTGVRSAGRGFEADVFFYNDWDYVDDPDDRGWTTRDIVYANMYGHPQHQTAVWKNSIEDIRKDWRNIAKNSLLMAGLPVE